MASSRHGLVRLEPSAYRAVAVAEGTRDLREIPADAGSASYNLSQVYAEMKKERAISHAGD